MIGRLAKLASRIGLASWSFLQLMPAAVPRPVSVCQIARVLRASMMTGYRDPMPPTGGEGGDRIPTRGAK